MSYPGKGKGAGTADPEIIPVTYATATVEEGNEQQQQQAVSEAQAIPPAAEAIQVVTIDESQHVVQEIASSPPPPPQIQQIQPVVSQTSQTSQVSQAASEPIVPPNSIDPTTIHVVTFDEPPSLTATRESTPLLHQMSNRSDNDEVASYSLFGNGSASSDEPGLAQCYDLPWAILFWGHIATVIYAGTQLAPQGYAMMGTDDFDLEKMHDFMQEHFVNDDDFTENDLDMLTDFLHQFATWWAVYPPRILWFAILMCCVSMFMNMLKNHLCIQTKARIFVASSVIIPGVLFGVFLILNLSNLGFGGFLVCSLIAVALAFFIRKELWPKMSFAALNLEVALTGIRSNLGTYLWAQCAAEVTVLWIIFWVYTFFGMIPYMTGKYCPEMAQNFDPNSDDTCPPTGRALLGLILSLYWTMAYVGNTVQVYVAGVMATWCFDKDAAQGWCSSAVTSSMYRSLTFSSGPIAFGSLLQGAAKVLRSILSHSNRNQHRSNQVVDASDDCRCCFGLCGLILECLSEVFGEILDYFNQWAYCFVGINGTSYLESGKGAMNLFKTRGWTALITDRLVALVLGVGILESGFGTGLVTILMERLVTWIAYPDDHGDLPPSYVFGPVNSVVWISFIFGFIVGCVMSGIMMNVIHGAVNTLIVCWAESPESFRDNHKYWADQMEEVWSSAFPGTQFQEVNGVDPNNLGRYGATTIHVVT